jgi:hypothetical protein
MYYMVMLGLCHTYLLHVDERLLEFNLFLFLTSSIVDR